MSIDIHAYIGRYSSQNTQRSSTIEIRSKIQLLPTLIDIEQAEVGRRWILIQ
jgi:hypothetical protein